MPNTVKSENCSSHAVKLNICMRLLRIMDYIMHRMLLRLELMKVIEQESLCKLATVTTEGSDLAGTKYT